MHRLSRVGLYFIHNNGTWKIIYDVELIYKYVNIIFYLGKDILISMRMQIQMCSMAEPVQVSCFEYLLELEKYISAKLKSEPEPS